MTKKIAVIIANLILALLSACGGGGASDNNLNGSSPEKALPTKWKAISNPQIARTGHTTSLLADGRYLVVGGNSQSGLDPLDSTELYDPITNVWTSGARLIKTRSSHTATVLPNGKVLVVGGYSQTGLTASAELYDPVSNSWSTVASPIASRQLHTTTLLPNGKLLIAGGIGREDVHNDLSNYQALRSVELFDPSTNVWETGGTTLHEHVGHTATLLPNGKLLLLGGYPSATKNAADATSGAFSELFDTSKGIGTQLPGPFDYAFFGSATMLKNGKVLYVNGDGLKPLAALYNPDTSVWTPAGSLSTGHFMHSATLLPNGKVMVIGGGVSTAIDGVSTGLSEATSVVELFDPLTSTWSLGDSLEQSPRMGHTATISSSGEILLVGGLICQPFDPARCPTVSTTLLYSR